MPAWAENVDGSSDCSAYKLLKLLPALDAREEYFKESCIFNECCHINMTALIKYTTFLQYTC